MVFSANASQPAALNRSWAEIVGGPTAYANVASATKDPSSSALPMPSAQESSKLNPHALEFVPSIEMSPAIAECVSPDHFSTAAVHPQVCAMSSSASVFVPSSALCGMADSSADFLPMAQLLNDNFSDCSDAEDEGEHKKDKTMQAKVSVMDPLALEFVPSITGCSMSAAASEFIPIASLLLNDKFSDCSDVEDEQAWAKEEADSDSADSDWMPVPHPEPCPACCDRESPRKVRVRPPSPDVSTSEGELSGSETDSRRAVATFRPPPGLENLRKCEL